MFKRFFHKLFIRMPILFVPETEKKWTTIYYGARGSGKTLHQSFETEKILKYLVRLYEKHPDLVKHAIVITNSKLSSEIEEKYGEFIYYWDVIEDFKFCPRKKCWRGKRKHALHGAYLICDDIATILPADNWNNTPMWFRKLLFQARHQSVRILGNVQDPFSYDINARRCTDRLYKFTRLFGNKDPDETKRPLKMIFGFYRRRKIDSEILWRYGDLPESTIRQMIAQKDSEDEYLRETGRSLEIVYDDSWRGSFHMYNRKGRFLGIRVASTGAYDTLQNVKEYTPAGFHCTEIKCIDPGHVHPWDYPEDDPKELKKSHSNYCDHVKRTYELV